MLITILDNFISTVKITTYEKFEMKVCISV